MRKPVLTIFYQFNPWHSSIGGIQTIICSFIKYAPEEFDLRLVGAGKPGEIQGVWYETEFQGRIITFMPAIILEADDTRRKIPTTLKYSLALTKHNFESDFVHFHRLEPSLAAFSWPTEKTFFIHNDIEKQLDPNVCKNAISWQKFPRLYFTFEHFLIQQFNEIIAFHAGSANFYQNKYPKLAPRIKLLKNMVDEQVFYALEAEDRRKQKQLFTEQAQLPEHTQLLMFVGRLHPQKDPLLLIKAFAQLKNPSVHLLIAGEGELGDEVHLAVECYGLIKQVTFLGKVDQARLANLYRICDLLIVTSAFESGPLVILEALSCGTPVVSTDCGEAANFISKESGIVCSGRLPETIALALAQILNHPDQYRPENCIKDALPYHASQIIHELYKDMLFRWQHKQKISQRN